MINYIEKYLHACAHDSAESVNMMLDSGFNVDIQMPDSSYTGLLKAAMVGNEETLALLIARGADVNHENHPLHFAALFGRTEICTALTRVGADTHAVDSDGNTPLHVAAEFGWLGACIALLNAGSDVNQTNRKGVSALQLANEAGGELEEAFRASADAWTLTYAAIAGARAMLAKRS